LISAAFALHKAFSASEAQTHNFSHVKALTDQRIATAHPDHLRYPPALLAQGLALVLGGAGVEEAVARVTAPDIGSTDVFEPAQSRFLDAIRRLPPLWRGVREGLLAVTQARIPVTIIPEERAERCRKFAAGLGSTTFALFADTQVKRGVCHRIQRLTVCRLH
jgi:hypothetical protein